jgi:hypothetical protein
MKRLNGWSVAVVLLSLVGCKGGGSGGPSTTADFCTQYADAICQIASGCGASMSGCVTYQEAQCAMNAARATSNGKRVYTPGNASACINAVSSAYGGSNPVITVQTMTNITLACEYVFQGNAKLLTDACTTQFDCAGATNGSIICDKSFCAMTASPTAAGQPCGNPGQVCVTDNYCAANASGVQVCTADAVSGAACGSTPCAQNLRCSNGICTTLLPSGSVCAANSDCASSAAYCDPYVNPPVCTMALNFSTGSPSCNCIAGGSCAGGGAGGAGGAGGSTGNGGAGGSTGAGGLGGNPGLGGSLGLGGLGGV